MAIKIAKAGNREKLDPIYDVTCRKCDCQFTCNKSDLKYISGSDSGYYSIACPECRNGIYYEVKTNPYRT